MHILYVHQNFPAQFGHIAAHLAKRPGWKCTFVSETPAGNVAGIEKVQFKLEGGATRHNHFCSRTFENTVWHCDAVYHAMKARPDILPDLIVGHSGFGSTLFLRNLYPLTPVINLFEYYYNPHRPDSDMGYRKDLGWTLSDDKFLRARCRNAMILLDLQNCDAAYAPTKFQKNTFPEEYRRGIRTLFDGIDRSVYHGHKEALRMHAESHPRTVAGVTVPAGTRLVTYVSRGFESMRGFDIFLRAADKLARQYPNVMFIVVGAEDMPYGGDESYIGTCKTFKEWVLSRESIDLSKFVFTGRIHPLELAKLLAMTDLHIYLTVPFVLSWSMVDAMSSGAVVLGSDTPPVRELITDGKTGLLADFFEPDAFVEKALPVLKDPNAFRPLGRNAEKLIREKYSLDVILPEMVKLYEETAAKPTRRF